MRIVTVYLPEPYVEALDQLVKQKRYPNRAEAVRCAVRDFIFKELGSLSGKADEEA